MIFFGDFFWFFFGDFFDLVFIFWFYAALMFFCFSGGLIFWFFDGFLMIFWFFYDFFLLGFNWFYSPKWVHFLKFSCNSFFLEYTGWRWWSGTVECHGVEFTALRLVFNRICKSIKKYKRGGLQLQAIHVYRLQFNFLRFYLVFLTVLTYVSTM